MVYERERERERENRKDARYAIKHETFFLLKRYGLFLEALSWQVILQYYDIIFNLDLTFDFSMNVLYCAA
jgi:hypothetical protein